MRVESLFRSLLLAAAAAGCTQTTDLSESDRVLLEIEYINLAFTPRYFGFHVDGSGNVYRYDRNARAWERQDSTSHSPGELSGKYSPVNNLQITRPVSEVRGLIPTIDAAAQGAFSQPKQQCADAGTLKYLAYTYSADTGRYTPVLLRVEGDFAQQNTSAAAQELIAYIRSLDLLEELLGCDP